MIGAPVGGSINGGWDEWEQYILFQYLLDAIVQGQLSATAARFGGVITE